MSDTPEDILDELTRIVANCDQVQVDINNARKRFEGIESVQTMLDEQQIQLDSQLSKIKVAKKRIKRRQL